MTLLILATRNAHKVEEIRAFLPTSLRYLSLRDLPESPGVIEDAASFAGNALKKARALAIWLQGASHVWSDHLPLRSAARVFCLADDSGLEVDVLHGAPGVLSARFAALDTPDPGNSSDAANNAKLLRLLLEVPTEKRTARFRCCLAVVPLHLPAPGVPTSGDRHGPTEPEGTLFDGVCEGRLLSDGRGRHGFGYDPLFVPEGFQESFAELGQDVKNRVSHRAKALLQFRRWLEQS